MTPLPLWLASTPTAIVTWQALHRSSERTTAAKASLLRRADNQQRALDVVADLVGHGAEEEAAGARHPLVADDQQVVVAVVGHLDESGRGVAVVDNGGDLHTRVAVASRFTVDDLLGLLPDARRQDRQCRPGRLR